MRISKVRALLYLLSIASLLSSVSGDAAALQASLTAVLCSFVTGIQNIIGIIALSLFLVGGAMYALVHFIPTSVDFRKSMQGWSSALIIGGLVGLIVVILAVPIVNMIGGFAAAGGVSFTPIDASTCPAT